MNNSLTRFLPFLSWWPLRGETVRADLIAGITVALVLILQFMAYAQQATALVPVVSLLTALVLVYHRRRSARGWVRKGRTTCSIHQTILIKVVTVQVTHKKFFSDLEKYSG